MQVADHPATLTGRKRETLDQLYAYSHNRRLQVADFGGYEGLLELLPSMAEHPLLTVVASALGAEEDALTVPTEFTAAAHALVFALADTKSPVIFADAARVFMSSPALLEVAGATLAAVVMPQARTPAQDADSRQVLRAADALEVATQLRIGQWAHRWDLFARLAAYDGRAPQEYGRSVLRSILGCVEVWSEAQDLLPAARRAAGLDPPITNAALGDDHVRHVVHPSDAGVAMARMSILEALRSTGPDALIAGLDDAARYLRPALGSDDRPDAQILADVASLLRSMVISGTVVDDDIVERLHRNVREMQHLGNANEHWVGERTAAMHTAWARLAVRLSWARRRFYEPSWLDAVAIVDDLVDLYRTAGSSIAFRRDDDGRAVGVIVAPVLEAGFAEQVGLLRHLQDYVTMLETVQAESVATDQQLADLPVARELRDRALKLIASDGGVRPKQTAGEAPLGGVSPADTRTESGTEAPSPSHADGAGASEADRILEYVRAQRMGGQLASQSLVVDELLHRAQEGLAKSPDYKGHVADAADLVAELLTRFMWDRAQLGPREVPYLFDLIADENDLAADLATFLRGSGRLGGVDTEVRHVGGGRVDVRFGFPGFNLYVELKQDSSQVPVLDKRAYLGQTASYQIAEPRLGFLIVLKRVPVDKAPPPHLLNCLEVVEVLDSSGEVRHVVTLTISGARTRPSEMVAVGSVAKL